MIGSKWLGILSGLVAIPLVFPQMLVAETNNDLSQIFPALTGVKLTSVQQKQLSALAEKTLPEVKKEFSSEQKQKFDQILASGKGVKTAIQSLELPLPQMLKQAQLLKNLRSQINQILTPDQQQQVMRNVISSESK